jgi:DNA ligase (NAD+)
MTKSKDNIIKNYLKKKKLLSKHNDFYYAKDSPIVTDEQYDDIKKESIELERNYTFLKKYGSVKDSVGFKP